MIRVKNISKSFNGSVVLDDVSAEFEQGKCNLIIGRSGSGKTVLLKSIVGLHRVDRGEIWFGDHRFSHLGPGEQQEIRKQMGMLFQGAALFDSMSVEENVRFPLDMLTDHSRAEKADRVNFCLDRVKVTGVNDQFPASLSGGMKKRVAIARAISLNPRYLFCDEPNSGLDPETGIVIDNLIREITEEFQMTTIINSHDMNSVLEIGDHVIFIHEGRKQWEGSNREILETENAALNNFVFATRLARQTKRI